MKKLLLAAVATFALSGVAFAADTKVELGVDLTQNDNDKIVADTTIDVTLSAPIGVASLGLVADEDAIKVDGYSLGTTVGNVAIAFGDQGDILDGFEGKTEAVGGATLANLDDAGESVKVSVAGITALIGLTDVTKDVTDVKNIQAGYSMATAGIEASGAIDYNLDSKETTLLSAAGYAFNGVGLGVTTTYQVDAKAFAYEADVTLAGVTAFVNGDKDDLLQNVGAGYYGNLNGMGLYAEAAYNVDTEEFKPAAGISFAF